MKKRIFVLGTMVCFSLSVAGCSSGIAVETAYDHSAPLATYRSFAMQLPAKAVPVPGNMDPFVMLRLRNIVHERLSARGFLSTSQSEADFIVAVNAAAETKTDTFVSPGAYRPAVSTTSETYTEGTLAIDFILPKENVVVWRGVAVSRVTKNTDDTRLREVTDAILVKFPPAKEP